MEDEVILILTKEQSVTTLIHLLLGEDRLKRDIEPIKRERESEDKPDVIEGLDKRILAYQNEINLTNEVIRIIGDIHNDSIETLTDTTTNSDRNAKK